MSPMNERLNGIEAFVAAVEAGNFALAAQRLQMTRSAVAKSVARLEARLGTRLFNRTTRSQSLTEDGHAYYARCRRALAELDAADSEVEASRQTPVGRLRVTAPELIGRALVAPLLLELGRRHPQLTFHVSFNDRRVDLIEEGIDLAVRSGSLDDSATLAARQLGHQWMGVYASPSYLAGRERPSNAADLIATALDHRFVGYARETGRHPWHFMDAEGSALDFLAPRRFEFACNSLEVAATAAIQGVGLARLPSWLVSDAIQSGQLVRVFNEPTPFGYALHALWPHTRVMPPKIRVLIDLMVERMPILLEAS